MSLSPKAEPPFHDLGQEELERLAALRRRAAQRQHEQRQLILVTLLLMGFFLLSLAIFILLRN